MVASSFGSFRVLVKNFLLYKEPAGITISKPFEHRFSYVLESFDNWVGADFLILRYTVTEKSNYHKYNECVYGTRNRTQIKHLQYIIILYFTRE